FTQILKKPEVQPPPLREVPLMFVDVNPNLATTEPPKDAKYYSDKNSVAANPEPKADTDTPRITGKQEHVVRTEDTPRQKFSALQPQLPADQAKEAQEEIKPKATYKPGDLAMAKPDLTTSKEGGEAAHPRPRTITEALALKPNNRLVGEKMRQEGGVRRLH